MSVATKPRLVNSIQVGSGNRLSMADLRMFAKNDPVGFVTRTQAMIDSGKLSWNDITDLRGMFQALGDVQVPVEIEIAGVQRSIMASAFPLLSGNLVVKAVNAAYESVETIGQELVQDMEDAKAVTVIANIHSMDVDKDSVKTSEDYPEIGATEEKFEIRNKRNGRMISINAETIEENNVADIVTRCNALGDIAADRVEEQTLARVTDLNGSTASPTEPYVMHQDGAAIALFSTSAKARGTNRINSNALVDYTQLNAARALLANMKNSRGKRINIPISQCTLLVPDALVGTALTILKSEYIPGDFNALNPWGPKGIYQPKLLSSPKLDDLSTTAYYIGIPRKQFVRKWKLRFEYMTLTGDTESLLRRRVVFQARIGWDVEIGASDYVYWVQSLSGTTAPVPA